MAVFMANICKYGCNVLFPSLWDLIGHIENKHIDFSPKNMELKEALHPEYIEMSYIRRFMGDHRVSAKEGPYMELVIPPEAESETWVSTEEYSPEDNRNTKKKYAPRTLGEKPFACPVPGCKKRYKNVNGMKYHSRNGHKTFNENDVIKEFLIQTAATKPVKPSVRVTTQKEEEQIKEYLRMIAATKPIKPSVRPTIQKE